MRLKDNVNPPATRFARSCQRGADLGWMMTVVVDHGDASRRASLLKAPVHTAKMLQPFSDFFRRHFQLMRNRHCGGRIEHVVPPRHMQFERSEPPRFRRYNKAGITSRLRS